METVRRASELPRRRPEPRIDTSIAPFTIPVPDRRAARPNGDLSCVPDATITTLVATSLRGRVFELVGAFFSHEGFQEDPRPAADAGSLSAHAHGAFSLRLITRRELDDLERIHRIATLFASPSGPRHFDDPRVSSECADLDAAPSPGDGIDIGFAPTPRRRFLGAAQVIVEALERRSLQLANLGRSALGRV